MAIIARDNDSKSFELPPSGNQQAVCAFVEDIGVHSYTYNGKEIESQKIVVCWELDEKMKEGDNLLKPFMLSKNFTLSLGAKANLRKFLESWRGKSFNSEELKGFDVSKLIGVNCLLNIINYVKNDGENGRKIGGISPCMSSMGKIQICNTKPPAWIQKEREKSINYQLADHTSEDFNIPESDDLPF